jgi:hypothetical protein
MKHMTDGTRHWIEGDKGKVILEAPTRDELKRLVETDIREAFFGPVTEKKRPGRPKGSKNKKKVDDGNDQPSA